MDQDHKGNPFLQIPNPFGEYEKSVKDLEKYHPELQEFARLCYEIFMVSKDGKKLMELLDERYIDASLINPHLGSAEILSLYWTGFTDCIKSFKMNAKQHKLRIDAA